MQEIWKFYKETNSSRYGKRIYEVSNFGNVKINGCLVDFSNKENQRYYYVGTFHVHRAVAELFVPNPYNKPEVDHMNTNKHDNRSINLRWVNRSENMLNNITHNKLFGRSAWNKGKHTGIVTKGFTGHTHKDDSKKIMSDKKIGHIPWNKGLKLK